MPRLFNKTLGVEFDAPDDGAATVLADSGWEPAPEPAPTPVGVEPEPVVYAPVTAPADEPKPKRTKPTTVKPD